MYTHIQILAYPASGAYLHNSASEKPPENSDILFRKKKSHEHLHDTAKYD